MCHSCLLGDRKYKHELPDPTSLAVKTDDLINGRYEWDPEYAYVYDNPKEFAGIYISEEEREERDLHERMTKVIDEAFPVVIIRDPF